MTEIEVGRGQLIFGRNVAENELEIDGSTIYRHIQKLEQWEHISIESNKLYSLITICNYSTYQDVKLPSEQATNNERTTNEHPLNNERTSIEHIQEYLEVKELKKEEKEREELPSPEKLNQYWKEFREAYPSNAFGSGKDSPLGEQDFYRLVVSREITAELLIQRVIAYAEIKKGEPAKFVANRQAFLQEKKHWGKDWVADLVIHRQTEGKAPRKGNSADRYNVPDNMDYSKTTFD